MILSPAQQTSLDFGVIRALRGERSLTLKEVSSQSGISIGILSRLERNQAKIELDTLYRLARVFNLSASDLLSLVENCAAHRKASESYESGPFLFERISFQGLEAFRGRARRGSSLSRPEAHGDEHEICWVISGTLRIVMTKESHELRAGEVLKFDAALAHTYEVLEDAELIIIHLAKAHRF